MPINKRILEAIILEEYQRFLDEEQAQQPAKPAWATDVRGISTAKARQAQLDQAKSATSEKEAEFTGLERSLIIDLENKFRELASVKGVNLVNLRPRIEQFLKTLYSNFSSEIEASKQSGASKETGLTKQDSSQNRQQMVDKIIKA